MLLVSKSRRVQRLSESSVARLMYAILIVNGTSFSAAVPPTRQGPCSDGARAGPTPEAMSNTSRLLVGPRVRKTGRTLRRRTFVSAGRC